MAHGQPTVSPRSAHISGPFKIVQFDIYWTTWWAEHNGNLYSRGNGVFWRPEPRKKQHPNGSKSTILPWGAILLTNTGSRYVVWKSSVSQTQSSHQTEITTNSVCSRPFPKFWPYGAAPSIFFKIGIRTAMRVNTNLAEETPGWIDK